MNGAEPTWVADAEARLRRRLHRFECPPSQTLGEYAMGLLEGEARAGVAGHVPECPRCLEEMTTVRSFLGSEPEAAPGLGERVRRIVAALVPPTRTAAAVALRGAEDRGTNTYRAEHVVVALGPGSVTDRRRAAIGGLIWSEGADPLPTEGGEARLLTPDGGLRSAPLSEHGNFELVDVPPGLYQLEIRLSDRIVVVEELRV